MISDQVLNPFGYTPESDLPHQIVSMPKWTEHYFFYGYDAENQFGMCVHIGRLQEEPTIWRSVLQMYLPGEDLLVAKTYGTGLDRGPAAGPLKITCIEPLKVWTVEFNGPAFSTTRSVITRQLVPDGPAELAKFFMVFDAAGPLHGLRPGKELTPGMTVAAFHTNQTLHMRGEAQYRGKRVVLNGMGVRDHSSGPRDYGPVFGDLWFHSLFPSGKIIHVQQVAFETFDYKTGYIFRGDGSPMEELELVEIPYVYKNGDPEHTIDADPLCGPDRTFRIVVRSSSGQEIVEGELLHTHAITYHHVMEEFMGTTLDRPGGIQMCEAPVRVRCNGEVGVGLRERSARTEALIAR
jgi:hypothetical protein